MRERLGDPNRMAIPLTYPGKRKYLELLDSGQAGEKTLSSCRQQAGLETGHWLTPQYQSLRAPARYPKATTIKRKDVWKEASNFTARGLSRWQQWNLSAHRNSARSLRPRKAVATVYCIYCTGAVRNARMNACQTGSKTMLFKTKLERPNHYRRAREFWNPR
jgi:hypothetical protein